MRPALDDVAGLRGACVGDRQQVGLGIALGVSRLQGEEVSRAVGSRYLDRVDDADRLQAARLARKPAPLLDVGSEDALEALPGDAEQNRVPAAFDLDLRQHGRGQSPIGGNRRCGARLHREPVEGMRAEGEEVRRLADDRQLGRPEQLDGDHAFPLRQVKLHHLQESGEVGDAEDLLGLVASDERQHLAVLRPQELERAAAERPMALPQGDEALHPRKQRVLVLRLRLDVDALVVVLGVGDDRQVEPLPVGAREARVAVGAPLHRRAHTVAIAEEDVVAHSDLVAVVEDRCPRQREEQAVHQLDSASVVAKQRGEAPADAEVDPRRAVLGVGAIHVVALLVGDHLERQLVVIAEEERPL